MTERPNQNDGGTAEQPSAARVDPKTYFASMPRPVENRGSISSLGCPECDAKTTMLIFIATPQSGKEQCCLRCVRCRTTWVINVPMARKLCLFPGDQPPDGDRDALIRF
jgi:hypothetical protein